MVFIPMNDESIRLLAGMLRGRPTPQSMREAADVREGINANYQAQLQSYAANRQAEAREHGDERTFEQAGIQRQHAEFMLNTRIAADQERQRRDQSFQLQKIMAKKRVASTPTGRGQLTGPRPVGSGTVSGPEGTSTLLGGEVVHATGGRELIDPTTGELDMSRFPLSESYAPPRSSMTQAGTSLPQADPLMTYLQGRRHEIPENQYAGLEAMLQSGVKLTANQFINQIEDAARAPKPVGRSARDIEVNLAILDRQRAALTREKDPTGILSSKYGALIQEEQRKLREVREGTYPHRGTSFTSEIDPQPGGLRLTQEIASEILAEANGDKDLARQLAAERGYSF